MYCRYCGHDLKDDDIICEGCGCSLSEGGADLPSLNEENEDKQEYNTPHPYKTTPTGQWVEDKMNVWEGFLSVWKHYATFSGRSRRMEFWGFVLFHFIICIIIAMFPEALSSSLNIIYGLAVFIPSLSLTFRRLHDTGRSGWWMIGNMATGFIWAALIGYMMYKVIFFATTNDIDLGMGVLITDDPVGFVQSFMSVIPEALSPGLINTFWMLTSFYIVYSIILLILYMIPGDVGVNRYGSDPKRYCK
jgi:uncharacterized membrane protein YhaH (DUF805 family)